jgi:hypothetical protein
MNTQTDIHTYIYTQCTQAFLSSDLVAAGVRVLQHQRVLDDCSDHFPVVVDLSGIQMLNQA